MKKIYYLILSLFLFACCPPLSPSGPKSIEELVHDVEDAESQFTADVSIAYVYDDNGNFAWVSCIPDIPFCEVHINKSEMERLRYEYGDVIVVYIVGHEFGHIQQFYPQVQMTSYEAELEADQAGGCVVKMLGYSIDPIYSMMLMELEESSTHPGPDKRWHSVQVGFNCVKE